MRAHSAERQGGRVGAILDQTGRVPFATYSTILVNRDFTSDSGLGRTIFVDLELNSTYCVTVANDLVTLNWGNGGGFVGLPSDLVLTPASAHYGSKVSLRETRLVSHNCAAPGSPVITSRDLGSVQVTADWVIGKRAGVHLCTSYATPPPPTLAFTFGWSSDSAQASMTLNGAVTVSLGPGTQYAGVAHSTNTVGGIPSPYVPGFCVPG